MHKGRLPISARRFASRDFYTARRITSHVGCANLYDATRRVYLGWFHAISRVDTSTIDISVTAKNLISKHRIATIYIAVTAMNLISKHRIATIDIAVTAMKQ